MLEMRPNCECCDAALPADSERAYICSFECTFCASCAKGHLDEHCSNCGGQLRLRPSRAPHLWDDFPASTEHVYKPDCGQA